MGYVRTCVSPRLHPALAVVALCVPTVQPRMGVRQNRKVSTAFSVVPATCAEQFGLCERCWQQNRHRLRHRLGRYPGAAACACVSLRRLLKVLARIRQIRIPFQYPCREPLDRPRADGDPSPASAAPSAVGNVTSSGSAPGTGATNASIPCKTQTGKGAMHSKVVSADSSSEVSRPCCVHVGIAPL